MAEFFWRRRVYNKFSPRYKKGSCLQELSDLYFEDYCICTQDANSGLCLRTFGVRHSYPEFQSIQKVSSRYFLFYVLAGKGYADGKPVKEGNIILFERNTPFNISADQDDPFLFAWITFKGKNAEEYLAQIGLKEGHQIYYTDNLQEIATLFYDILYIDHDSKNTALYLESRLIDLLSMLQNLTPVYNNTNPPKKKINKHINKAILYIQKNCLRQNFHVGDVARALDMNEKYLRRLFQKEMKLSIRDYVTDFRIRTAQNLLKNSNYNISEISDFVGYRDYRQFYTQFKNKNGCTPSDYAKNN